jgi:glycosyltransferase involved in cell wall biosynthesis
MKILVLSHEFPPIGGGGGQVVQDIAAGFAANQHKVHILTSHWGNLPQRTRNGNLIIERLLSARRQAYRASLFSMIAFVWKAFWNGLRLIRKWHPDVIHAHFAVPAGAAAAALNFFTHIPFIVTAHGGDVPGGAPEKTAGWFKFVLPFSRIVWKRAAAVIAVSPETKRLAQVHYDVPIQVIPNGINLDSYKPKKREKTDHARIIYIGRFSPEKNAVAVPEVMAGLEDLSWHCVMLGDGPDMSMVQNRIQELDLDDRFTLSGWVSPEVVKKHLALSDILLLPSKREGMPIAGLQGLAMGLALVLSRIGSCPDLVSEGKNGYLVAVNDFKGYRSALRKIIESPSLLEEFQKNSREIAYRFDLKKTYTAYESLFIEITRNGKK